MNVILISLDAVRADVGYSSQFPGIEWHRERGITFLNAISVAPLTPVSHASVLTGLLPQNHGIRHLFREKLKPGVISLARIFRANGYQTGAIVSCPGLNAWYGLANGFSHYDDEISRFSDGTDPLQTVDVRLRGTALKRAPLVVDRGIRWLRQHCRKPFFLFLHLFDAHWPYEAPEKFGGRNPYEEEVAYSDAYMYRFIQEVERLGLLEDTLIVLFSDHGEDLAGWYANDKGGEALGRPEEDGHGSLLYDTTQRVLLIFVVPDCLGGRQISEQVRLLDVAPTILDLCDLPREVYNFDGVSLGPVIRNGWPVPELIGYSETFYPEEQLEASHGEIGGGVRKAFRIANRYKIILDLSSEVVEFYDLTHDPNETNNLNQRRHARHGQSFPSPETQDAVRGL